MLAPVISTASRAESLAHRELKSLALQYALDHGYRIAAVEVSIPNRGIRADVAAYHPRRKSLGTTALFECKASAADFRRDARSIIATRERLEVLHARKLRIEEELKLHYPSIRNGDSLFAEFETLNFERPGYERYEKCLAEMKQLSNRLHQNTKFDQLTEWASANLYYVVADAGVLRPQELPAGWGLLQRSGSELILAAKPVWHEADDAQRLEFLHRVAMRATRNTFRPVAGKVS